MKTPHFNFTLKEVKDMSLVHFVQKTIFNIFLMIIMMVMISLKSVADDS